MKKLLLLAGALLVTGGTTVLAENVSEPMYQGRGSYRIEERYPEKSINRWRGRHFFKEGSESFRDERMKERHQEMKRFYTEFKGLLDDEREGKRISRNGNIDNYTNESYEGYDNMRPRRDFRPGCGF